MASGYAADPGAGIIEKLGPERIRARASLLVRELFERLQDAGFDLATPEEAEEDERAGIVMVRVADPPRVLQALAEERIIVDDRPGRVRVSPYFYNTS